MLVAGAHLGDQIKPELHRSVVEVGTPVCADIREARAAVRHLRGSLVEMAEKSGVRIVAAGTHPFSHWKDQEITDRERYVEIVNEMEDLARANLIFGLHVHVGIEDREMQIQIMNAVRGFLPHLLALSVNSPFWCGRKTGVKSVRSTDVRPHAHFKTLEFRICDIPSRMEETIMIAALIQALVCKLRRVLEGNLSFRVYERAVIMENKFRALKRGLDGHMIAFDLKAERPTRELTAEILDFVDDVVDELGTREEMARLRVWAHAGDTGADRQIAVWENTHDLRAVVDFLVDETRRDL
jgi:carboxylate-amine ligase